MCWCKVSTKHNKNKYRIGFGGVHADRQFPIAVASLVDCTTHVLIPYFPHLCIFSIGLIHNFVGMLGVWKVVLGNRALHSPAYCVRRNV